MKRSAMDWEKTFANHVSDKELVFKIHKELSKVNNQKTRNTKIYKRLKQIFHLRCQDCK